MANKVSKTWGRGVMVGPNPMLCLKFERVPQKLLKCTKKMSEGGGKWVGLFDYFLQYALTTHSNIHLVLIRLNPKPPRLDEDQGRGAIRYNHRPPPQKKIRPFKGAILLYNKKGRTNQMQYYRLKIHWIHEKLHENRKKLFRFLKHLSKYVQHKS